MAYAGQLTADDKNRINAISRNAMRRGLTLTAFDIDSIIDKSDHKLFRQATQPVHIVRFNFLPTTKTCFVYCISLVFFICILRCANVTLK